MELVGLEVRPESGRMVADDVRQLPLGGIIADARKHHTAWYRRLADQGALPRETATEWAESWGPHRGRRISDAELERTAGAYLAAWRAGEPVTAAVAEALGLSSSTAGKRIMAARRAGLLPAAR
jgi:hypothetical protein